MANNHDQEADFDPQRRLCPDGSCIGIIGLDGRCTVCGATDTGARPAEAPTSVPPANEEPREEGELDGSPDDPKEPGAFDPARRLCGDGSCIGVIGPDSRCSVCGKAAD